MDGISDFAYGELVEINNDDVARIKGKVKDLDCYVVLAERPANISLIIQLGIPNRHLKLEWGSFKGFPNEFIVPATIIRKL